jgi:MoxR-like ATPase
MRKLLRERLSRSVIQTWPLSGRHNQVALILRDLNRGMGTVIEGEVGVGKTMLACDVPCS